MTSHKKKLDLLVMYSSLTKKHGGEPNASPHRRANHRKARNRMASHKEKGAEAPSSYYLN